MAVPQRVASLALAVVALALTVGGVIAAASDANPAGGFRDPLALHGVPPTSTQLHVVLSSGPSVHIEGNVTIDFATNTAEAQLQIPLFFSATTVDLRFVHHHLYAGSANLSSIVGKPWLALMTPDLALHPLAAVMLRPDTALITRFGSPTTTHSGASTTYSFTRHHVALSTTHRGPTSNGTSTVHLTLTVGSGRELTGFSLSLTSPTSSRSIAVTVLSYNQPVSIHAPAPRDVRRVTLTQLQRLLGSTPLGGVLSLKNLSGLGQLRLN